MASGLPAARGTFAAKVVLLGNAAVGKSCIVQRFARDEFVEDPDPTIGAAFLAQTISLDNETVRLDIWDTAGQERYKALAPMYYRGAQAAIVVYSIADKESFDGAKAWIAELERRAEPGTVIALAGNKADLGDSRQVDTDVAREFADKHGIFFLETSALDGRGVKEVFYEVAKRVPKVSRGRKEADVLRPAAPKTSSCCG